MKDILVDIVWTVIVVALMWGVDSVTRATSEGFGEKWKELLDAFDF